MSEILEMVQDDFYRARRRALFSQLLALITHTPNELLSFEHVRAHLNVRGQHYLGHQTVPIAQIVGSEGRYNDFDRQFAPRHEAVKLRWLSVNKAHYQDVHLPAVELYKLGDIYFVRDGNHRISVARLQGKAYIDALVTELEVDVPLEPGLSVRDLLLKEEYSDFLEWTGLAQLRPEQRIEFSEPGGYLTLVRHINVHRYYLALERGAEVSSAEATASWYDQVYMPVIWVVRESGALQAFPGRTEADLYRWSMDHRWFLRERNGGTDPGPAMTVEDYVQRFGRRSLADLAGQLAQRLSRILRPHAIVLNELYPHLFAPSEPTAKQPGTIADEPTRDTHEAD